jgi:glycosyltransferase involved in cell wall biosynthesis
MKILFHENQLTERGTSVAMFDYAYYARELLDIEPIITYRNENSKPQAIQRFKNNFEVFSYDTFDDVETYISKNSIDAFYAIKYGYHDGIVSSNTKNLIHSVFCKHREYMHGERYAVVSEWQSHFNDIPYVPHILNLYDTTETLRDNLNIPKDALVIGRHGGFDTFNIDFVIDSIKEILDKRSDIWFLFLNTEKKLEHQRVIYLDATVDLKEKTKFINTCDAMIHARDYGETFGLSVLEFAAKDKPIISYDNEYLQTNHQLGGRNHFLFLQDHCYKYSHKGDLDNIFLNIERNTSFNTSYLLDKFSPQSVMKLFEERFLV